MAMCEKSEARFDQRFSLGSFNDVNVAVFVAGPCSLDVAFLATRNVFVGIRLLLRRGFVRQRSCIRSLVAIHLGVKVVVLVRIALVLSLLPQNVHDGSNSDECKEQNERNHNGNKR